MARPGRSRRGSGTGSRKGGAPISSASSLARAEQGRTYNGVARSFHWLVAGLLLVQYGTKWVPASWASEATLNAWHLAVGPTILLLMVLRLLWRLTHRPPPAPADLSVGLRVLSRATHWGFYLVLIVLPVLGWLAASGYGATPTLLGVVPLPALTGHDEHFAAAVGGVHGAFAVALLALLALHVTGALYHALVKRDGVIWRMASLRTDPRGLR